MPPLDLGQRLELLSTTKKAPMPDAVKVVFGGVLRIRYSSLVNWGMAAHSFQLTAHFPAELTVEGILVKVIDADAI